MDEKRRDARPTDGKQPDSQPSVTGDTRPSMKEDTRPTVDAAHAGESAKKRRGSIWGVALGAAALLLGALIGLPRFGLSGQVWTIAGAVLLGYNVWALLRRGGNSAAPSFAQPDPAAEERARDKAKAALAELERQYRAGEIGYEEYMKRRMEVVSGA